MPLISSSWTFGGDVALADYSLLVRVSLLMGRGVSVGRISERWLNGFFLADSERYMADSIFTGLVGVNGSLGFEISEALLSLRPTDTKF